VAAFQRVLDFGSDKVLVAPGILATEWQHLIECGEPDVVRGGWWAGTKKRMPVAVASAVENVLGLLRGEREGGGVVGLEDGDGLVHDHFELLVIVVFGGLLVVVDALLMAVGDAGDEFFVELGAGGTFKLLQRGGFGRGDLLGEHHVLRGGQFFELLVQGLVVGDEGFSKGFDLRVRGFLHGEFGELRFSMAADGGVLDELGFAVGDGGFLDFGLTGRIDEKHAADGESEGREEFAGEVFHEVDWDVFG
jgi:hypothetical protein